MQTFGHRTGMLFYHTDEESIFGTIWHDELFNLTENVQLHITNLKRKDMANNRKTSGEQCNPLLTTTQQTDVTRLLKVWIDS